MLNVPERLLRALAVEYNDAINRLNFVTVQFPHNTARGRFLQLRPLQASGKYSVWIKEL